MPDFEKSWMMLLVGLVIPLVMAGCDSPPESSPPPKPAAVTVSVPTAAVKKNSPKISETPIPSSVQQAEENVKMAEKPLPLSGPGESTQASGVAPQQPAGETQDNEVPAYTGEGKIDPFVPLVTAEKSAPSVEKEISDVPQRILTPLEKLDFSQMRLVAVVQKGNENIAMVEESGGSNKGYIIKVGTYMGKNGGKVVSIMDDRIIIQEMVRNFKGEQITQSQEMKLHKPENED